MKKLSTLLLAMSLLFSFKAFSIPKLNSYPGFTPTTATMFLDFDGHYVNSSMWNNGLPINCASAGMSDAYITEAFWRVAEDYRPFMINITTDSTVFLAAPLTKRIRIIITSSSSWCPGVGGVAYVGSFTFGDDTPAFVFSDQLGYSPKYVGEAVSHEGGHTVGLSHQSRYGTDCSSPTEYYHSGIGGGEENSWAPIMGNSYYRNMSNWNNGPTPDMCTATQDNLSIITTQNGFGYRPDDFGQTMNASTYALGPSNFSVTGIITTNSDMDAFKFVIAQNSNFHLTAVPFNVSAGWIGADLDIKLELYNGSGTLIKTYDPASVMSVTVDTVLLAGTYFLRIDGTGNTNIGEYGSLGSYTISGTTGALPIHDVALVGSIDKGKHNLDWHIIADEPIKSITVESSTDGIVFNKLSSVAPNATKFSYTPGQNNTIYYRLKVVSTLDQTAYSNTIALKSTGAVDKPFFVSTLVHNDITVNAPDKFSYRLSDMNGRVLSTGGGMQGMNKISTYNLPNGMYIIQLSSNNHQQTERIVRQ